MNLVCSSIRTDQIKKGDELSFDYRNPKQNIPSRAGFVIAFWPNDRVVLWDYSLEGGPEYRSYKLEYIVNLGRLEFGVSLFPALTPIERYKRAIVNYGRKIFGIAHQ